MKQLLLAVMLTTCASTYVNAAQDKTNSVKVTCDTTKGKLDIVVEKDWSPLGAARFLQLVDDGFFKNVPLFRCVDNFLCQFGYAPPRKDAKTYSTIGDDPKQPALRNFKRGYLSFAGSGEKSRSNHMFITLGEKVESLGTQPWETPFGYITPDSLKKTVSQFNTSYGDMAPWGKGPDPQKISAADGAAYLKKEFPQLDYINSCSRR
ncbi:peptidylprolyl isomerase [Andreprevotia chitinilytica]|uniref:peptidylprolyl isomerase n=1 Tax=Andreprevotia chitinilytica TaxID=396808 RepID=UPI001470039E|nr:peptidylprolyl isomerase [Andreprevotia chitinilytica]